jgi:hypothetical protein
MVGAVVALLRRGNTVAMASHLPLACLWPLCAVWRTRLFATDRDAGKIVRYLRTKEVRFTEPVVQHYCRAYGASYLDVEHILERFPAGDFDHAFHLFQKFCRLQRS